MNIRVTILIALALSVGSLSQAERFQWSGNGHWYEPIGLTDAITWVAASNAAVAAGGYLATLASPAENDFVFSLIRDQDAFWFHGTTTGPWIGAYQPAGSSEPSGGWTWVTGEPFTFTAWSPGEPNGGVGENYAIFWHPGSRAATWNDFAEMPAPSCCISSYVIEYDTNPSLAVVVSGYVRDTSGAVLPAVAVLALQGDNIVRASGTSDSNGYYRLPPVPAAVYELRATKFGWLTDAHNGVVLSTNMLTVAQNFSMDPRPAAPQIIPTNRVPEATQIPQFSTPYSTQLLVLSNGIFVSGMPLDTNKMTIALTYGWIPSASQPPIGVDGWPTAMAESYAVAGITNIANIVSWDWAKDATSDRPSTAKARAPGLAFGSNLLSGLGAGYTNHLHLLGHSLGALLNAAAADYLHGDAPKARPPWTLAPQRTHLTLFDEAELARVVSWGAWPSPIPKHYWWIDNYISAFGFVHDDAVNGILIKGYPYAIYGSFDNLFKAFSDFHAYPQQWYAMTITTCSDCLMGNRWSFERGGFTRSEEHTSELQSPYVI